MRPEVSSGLSTAPLLRTCYPTRYTYNRSLACLIHTAQQQIPPRMHMSYGDVSIRLEGLMSKQRSVAVNAIQCSNFCPAACC